MHRIVVQAGRRRLEGGSRRSLALAALWPLTASALSPYGEERRLSEPEQALTQMSHNFSEFHDSAFGRLGPCGPPLGLSLLPKDAPISVDSSKRRFMTLTLLVSLLVFDMLFIVYFTFFSA